MRSNKIISGLLLIFVVLSCESYEQYAPVSDLTGNSVTYSLQSSSYWNVTGIITFLEKKNGSTKIEMKLEGIPDKNSNKGLPVHLHYGDITTEKADVAFHLQSIYMRTGTSNTHLNLPYEDFKKMNGCVKVHLSESGEGRNIVIAAGNIGNAVTGSSPNGRVGIGVCKSE